MLKIHFLKTKILNVMYKMNKMNKTKTYNLNIILFALTHYENGKVTETTRCVKEISRSEFTYSAIHTSLSTTPG